MTPSNTRPQTATRWPRRAFLVQAFGGLLAALLVAPAPALAQGVIQFSVGSSTFTRYRVNDDGTGLQSFAFPQTSTQRIHATTRSDYQGGRQYLYIRKFSSNRTDGDLMAWCEGTGQIKAVTSLPSSSKGVYVGGGPWSNDGLDSFVSFTRIDGNNGWTYRAHVSAADIASPSYQPISSLSDTRLELVCNFALIFHWWNHDGSGFFYIDPYQGNLIRAKTVGFVSNTPADDPVVFTAPVQRLGHLRVIPAVDPLNPVSDRYLVASGTNSSNSTGILAIDLQTQAWQWLATPATSGLSQTRGPSFSPDGSFVAFGGTRLDSKGVPYHGVYKVPFLGGPITRVTEVKGSKFSVVYPQVDNWNIP